MRRQPHLWLTHRPSLQQQFAIAQRVLLLVLTLLALGGRTDAQKAIPASPTPGSSATTKLPVPPLPSIPPQCAQCPHSTPMFSPSIDNNSTTSSSPFPSSLLPNNNTTSNGSSNSGSETMTCHLHSQCVPLEHLCDPSLDGQDCDQSDNQVPLACGLDGICYPTNDQLPYPSPGKGAPSASQCDKGFFVALVGNKYTRSCLFKTMQPATECSPWEYSYRGYCFLATCNATAPCPSEFECRSVDPSTQAGICRHPNDAASDRPWTSGGGSFSGDDNDQDDDDDDGSGFGGRYSSQDRLIEAILVGASSLLFGGLVGACFWYRKRRREQRIQWERQGHGSRQGSFAGAGAAIGSEGVVVLSIDGHTKGTRFIPSWIERRLRSKSRHGGEDDREGGADRDLDDSREDLETEDGAAAAAATTTTRRSVSRQRQSSQQDRLNGRHRSIYMGESEESPQGSNIRPGYGRHQFFAARGWFWNFDGMAGNGAQFPPPRQPPLPLTAIAMMDVSPEMMDPPPVYTQRPDLGLPTYGDVTGEDRPAEETVGDREQEATGVIPSSSTSPIPVIPHVDTDTSEPSTLVAHPEAAVEGGTLTSLDRGL
ncbi:hypothetical protein BGZ73_001369 [Actinomortierella ambigua]|nr:hypothetical protein BGZ73_001369 [Actinomortierella ambigua]